MARNGTNPARIETRNCMMSEVMSHKGLSACRSIPDMAIMSMASGCAESLDGSSSTS